MDVVRDDEVSVSFLSSTSASELSCCSELSAQFFSSGGEEEGNTKLLRAVVLDGEWGLEVDEGEDGQV